MGVQTGFKVRELFHPTAMVDDLRKLERFYSAVFSVASTTIPYSEQSHAYRTLTVIADTCIENISPEQTHLSQFRMYTDLVGSHWYFPCFYVDDMQAAVYELHHRRRIRMTASGTGAPVVGLPPGGNVRTLLYTHPADTGIMWEFWEGSEEWFRTNPLADPRKKPGWRYQAPADDDPIAVEQLSHLTIVLDQPGAAQSFLVDVCGGRVVRETHDEALAARSTWIAVGEVPTLFELTVPMGPGPRQKDLARVGNTSHSVNFKVRDLKRAAQHLSACGIRLETASPRLLVTDPDDCCGLRFGFVDAFPEGSPDTLPISTRS